MFKELCRVLFGRRTLSILCIAVVLNGIVFYRQQEKEQFGFSEYTSQAFEALCGSVDPTSYLISYNELFQQYETVPLEESIRALRQRAYLYEDVAELQAIVNAVESGAELSHEYRQFYDFVLEQYPRALVQIENDMDTFRMQLYIDGVAAQKLLGQLEYLKEYPDYINSIYRNAEKLKRFPALSNGFDGKAIEKTATDFYALDGVSVTLCRDGAVDSLFSNQITDYVLILLFVYFALCCLQERQDGLWAVIHSQPRGRWQLALQRVSILIVCSIVCVLLLYGENLLIAVRLYGGGFWNASAQSISLFQKYPVKCTVAGVLLRFCGMRVVTAAALVELFFLLFSATRRDKLMLFILAIVSVAEYSMYSLLPARSVWNIPKYVNLFSLVHISELFTTYLNLNVLGTPVTIRRMIGIVSIILIAVWGVGAVWLHQYIRPYGRQQNGLGIYALVKRMEGTICSNLGSVGLECYKVFILQRGWVIALLFVVMTFTIEQTAPTPRTSADDYYKQLFGQITEKSQNTLSKLIRANDIEMQLADKLKDEWSSGVISFDTYFSGMSKYAGSYDRAQVLMQVQDRMTHLMELSQETTLWMVDSTSFDSVFSAYSADLQIKKALILLAAICLLLSGMIAIERQSNMTNLLRSTPNGRRILRAKQYGLMAVLSVLLSLMQSAAEFTALLQTDAIEYLSVPVQSISWLEQFPLKVPLWGFVVIVDFYRIIVTTCIGCIILWISSLLSSVRVATFLSLGMLIGPTLIYYYVGVIPFKWISAAIPISGVGILWDWNGSMYAMWLAGGVCVASAIASVIWIFQGNERRAAR